MRRPLVAANWKMHLVRAEAAALCAGLRDGLGAAPQAEVVIFPSAPLLDTVARALADSGVAWGGQDVHQEKAGAFTGDVSAAQLRDAGCSWALCGHSERRSYHSESDELVGAKMKAAEAGGLRALFCLGELEGERQAGRTEEVLSRQLAAALAAGATNFDIAYEPVWAIGTGATATPAQAQEAHALLRAELARLRGAPVAAATRILYGGSVKPENAAELFAGKDVDGFLVGGASLDCGKFLAIIAGSAG
jgi:triosephosphate isomerase